MLLCISSVTSSCSTSLRPEICGDEIGLVPHSQPVLPVEKFVAFLSQIPPRGPFLPVAPVYNFHTVNNLHFLEHHGMEEVIGSIPIRSTKEIPIE